MDLYTGKFVLGFGVDLYTERFVLGLGWAYTKREVCVRFCVGLYKEGSLCYVWGGLTVYTEGSLC